MAASIRASAWPTPCRDRGAKWRPRIVLLTAILGVAAAAHIVALPVAALLGLAAMLWIAEGHRSQALPVVLAAVAGALVLVFACYGFSPDAFSYVFRSAAGFVVGFAGSGVAILRRACEWRHTVAACAALVLYLGGAQVALLRQHGSAALRFGFDGAGDDGLSGKPVALGAAISADVCGRRICRCLRRAARTAGRWRAAGAIVVLQAVLCVMSLPGLV